MNRSTTSTGVIGVVDFVRALKTPEPSGEQIRGLTDHLLKQKSRRVMTVFFWLVCDAVVPDAQWAAFEAVRGWKPQEKELAEMLKIGGGKWFLVLLWLIRRSKRATEQLESLLDLAESNGFRVPKRIPLSRVAEAPAGALLAGQRRILRDTFPILYGKR